MKDFNDKVVWITGASSGLGRTLAMELNELGAKLILSGTNLDALIEIKSETDRCQIVLFDMNDTSVLQSKVYEAIYAYGSIDMVIHNAGVAQSSTALKTDKQVEEKILQIDYLSPVQITKCLLPHFIERKKGHIVVVSGLLAYLNLPGRSTYAAAKAALTSYFGCLRAEVAQFNVNVSVVVPGSLATNLVNKALTGDGGVVNTNKEPKGYTLAKAAKDILKSVSKNKSQIYVGSKGEFVMWKLFGLYPNFVIKRILSKVT